MKGEPGKTEEDVLAAQPAPADYLKLIWGISDKKRPRDKPPPNVSSDIYTLPSTEPVVPPRTKPRGP
jgi:hypothetical protein